MCAALQQRAPGQRPAGGARGCALAPGLWGRTLAARGMQRGAAGVGERSRGQASPAHSWACWGAPWNRQLDSCSPFHQQIPDPRPWETSPGHVPEPAPSHPGNPRLDRQEADRSRGAAGLPRCGHSLVPRACGGPGGARPLLRPAQPGPRSGRTVRVRCESWAPPTDQETEGGRRELSQRSGACPGACVSGSQVCSSH